MAKRLKVDCETACMITVELDSFLSRGSEWGYLDNSKQLIFWLCNSKFYAEGNKNASKKGNVILFSMSTSFRPLSDDSRSFRKTSEDFRRCPETTEVFQGEIRKIQCKLVKLKKFPQMFLDGCHAGLLWKVKSDPSLCLSKAESSLLL